MDNITQKVLKNQLYNVLYDPKSHDPFFIPIGVDPNYYLNKGYLVEVPAPLSQEPKRRAKRSRSNV